MEEKNIMVSLGDSRIKEISEVIGNKTCNKILDLLADKESTVGEISSRINIPINTADYNVKKLVKAGLIESSKSWWSVKGKKMPSYRLSNKKIIISPKGIISKVVLFPILAIVLLAIGLKNVMHNVGNTFVESTSNIPSNMMTASKFAIEPVLSTPMLSSVAPQASRLASIASWEWFLMGGLIAILIYFLTNIISERRNDKMDNSVKITGMILVTVIVLTITGFSIFGGFADNSGQTVQVSGDSQIKVTPDKVSIMFNVETNGTTAKEAKDKNSEMVDEVLTNLIKVGYAREDIETLNFNIYEDFDWSNNMRKSLGFKATHSIRVISKSNDLIGETIDAGVNAGASISYINFELSNDLENKYKADALKAATEDAKVKALAMAEGLDKKLGDIVSVSNSEFNYVPWMAYDAASVKMAGTATMGESVETNINPSSQEVTATVSVVYKLK